MKKTLVPLLLAVPLLLTGCGGDAETTTAISSSEYTVEETTTPAQDRPAECDSSNDGTFELASAEIVQAPSGARSVRWTFNGDMPAGSEVAFGASGGGSTMGVKMTNGEVTANYWMPSGGANNYSEMPVDSQPGSVSVAVPPAIAPDFNDGWMADLTVDSQRVSVCNAF